MTTASQFLTHVRVDPLVTTQFQRPLTNAFFRAWSMLEPAMAGALKSNDLMRRPLVSRADVPVLRPLFEKWARVVRACLVAELERERERGAEEPASQAFLRPDGCDALLRKHSFEAVNSLITGSLACIDPAIGGEGCDMRPSFLLDAHARVQAYLCERGLLASALQRVASFAARHRNDAPDPRVTRASDVADDRADEAYLQLVDDVQAHLDALFQGAAEYLALCRSLTACREWSVDAFGTSYRCRSNGLFLVDTQVDRHDGRASRPSLKDVEPELRERFGQLGRGLLRHMADRFDQADTGRAPGARQSLDNMLARALRGVDAGEPRLWRAARALPADIACRAMFLHEFRQGRTVTLMVRRIRIEESATGALAYSLQDARPILYRPDPRAGTYVACDDFAGADLEAPGLLIDAFSTFKAGSDSSNTAAGLYSEDPDAYFAALRSCDFPLMMQIHGAGESSSAGAAADADSLAWAQTLRHESVDVCAAVPQSICRLARAQSGGSFRVAGMDASETDLVSEFNACWLLAREHGLIGQRQIVAADLEDCPRRIDRAADFVPERIVISSFHAAQRRCRELIEALQAKTWGQVVS